MANINTMFDKVFDIQKAIGKNTTEETLAGAKEMGLRVVDVAEAISKNIKDQFPNDEGLLQLTCIGVALGLISCLTVEHSGPNVESRAFAGAVILSTIQQLLHDSVNNPVLVKDGIGEVKGHA
jgi:hypothetical protein